MVIDPCALCDALRMVVAVRPSRTEDGCALREIERAAGERFREVGLPDVADDEPLSVEVLARYAMEGRSWVAVDDAGNPIGYVIFHVIDGNAHVEQISVLPDHQGTGAGRALHRRTFRAQGCARRVPPARERARSGKRSSSCLGRTLAEQLAGAARPGSTERFRLLAVMNPVPLRPV